MRFALQKHLIKYLKISIAFVSLMAILYGCVATKSNLSVVDENYISPVSIQRDENRIAAKILLTEISSNNELLTIEIGRLPELQDGVSMKEKYALDSFADLIISPQSRFDPLITTAESSREQIQKWGG